MKFRHMVVEAILISVVSIAPAFGQEPDSRVTLGGGYYINGDTGGTIGSLSLEGNRTNHRLGSHSVGRIAPRLDVSARVDGSAVDAVDARASGAQVMLVDKQGGALWAFLPLQISARYMHDQRVNWTEVGPEVSVAEVKMFVPISKDKKSFFCIEGTPAPRVSASKMSDAAGYSANLKFEGDICLHVDLGREVGQINVSAGGQANINYAQASAADGASLVYRAGVNVGMSKIGGSPIGLNAETSITSATPSGGNTMILKETFATANVAF